MEIPSWYKPAIAKIEGSKVIVQSVGSGIEPYMTKEQVEALKERLKNEWFRIDLASFIGMIANRAKFGNEDSDEIRCHAGYMAVDGFIALTHIAESDEWPTGYSPPEFYDQAIQTMTINIS